MASKIEIWNMALGVLGCGSVSNESERSNEAIACSMYWDMARRTVLRDFPYSFAQRRAFLATTNMLTEYEHEYGYAYYLPENMLKAQYISNAQLTCSHENPFIIVQGPQGIQILLCNLSPCLLTYSIDIKDSMSRCDDSFTEMLMYKLASLICIQLLKSSSHKLQEVNQMYSARLAHAMQNDATSRKVQKKKDTWVSIMTSN